MHIVVRLLNTDKKDRRIRFEIDQGNGVSHSRPVLIDNDDRLQLQLELTAAVNQIVSMYYEIINE